MGRYLLRSGPGGFLVVDGAADDLPDVHGHEFVKRRFRQRITTDDQKASVPGFGCRWISACLTVSVRFGSMTTIVGLGFLPMVFSVFRALGMPCA